MGSTVTTSQTSQQVTPTPQEQEFNELQLERVRAAQPGQLSLQAAALSLGNRLLKGEALPGTLAGIGGISEADVDTLVGRALEDVGTTSQQFGILDSGIAQQLATETSANIRADVAQANIQNKLQLLNLALGGQTQIQQPLLGQAGQVGQQLAGLRSVSGSGTQSQQFSFFTNPFVVGIGGGLASGFGRGFGAAAGADIFGSGNGGTTKG